MVDFDDEEEEEYSDDEKKEEEIWSWRKLLGSVFSNREKRPKDVKGKGKSPDSYNLYDRKPDFKNNYGWSVALDETSYSPLRKSGFGVYLVNLTAVTIVHSSYFASQI